MWLRLVALSSVSDSTGCASLYVLAYLLTATFLFLHVKHPFDRGTPTMAILYCGSFGSDWQWAATLRRGWRASSTHNVLVCLAYYSDLAALQSIIDLIASREKHLECKMGFETAGG